MIKRSILALSFASLLLGCSEGESERAAIIVQGNGAAQVAETALYFPGGVGIDFGKRPVKDEIVETEVGGGVRTTRFVTYEFDSNYKLVDEELTQVLESEGYMKTELSPAAGRIVDIRYAKDSRNVMAYYKEAISEGFSKKTILVIYWRQ